MNSSSRIDGGHATADRQQLREPEDDDYSFISIESDTDQETGSSDEKANTALMSLSTNALGGQQPLFGGLAVAPLALLQKQLVDAPLSEQDVMKLRSIMRFSIEYHNPLVVHSQNLSPLDPVKQFVDAATECFQVLHDIVVALSTDSTNVNSIVNQFRHAQNRLAALEDAATEQVQDSTTLTQSIHAVRGQMDDFTALMEESILPPTNP